MDEELLEQNHKIFVKAKQNKKHGGWGGRAARAVKMRHVFLEIPTYSTVLFIPSNVLYFRKFSLSLTVPGIYNMYIDTVHASCVLLSLRVGDNK